MFSGIKRLTRIPRKFAQAKAVKNILRLRIATAAFFMSSRHVPAVFGALGVLLFVMSSHAESDTVVFSKASLFFIATLGLLGDWFTEYWFLRKHMELRNLFVRIDSRNEKKHIST